MVEQSTGLSLDEYFDFTFDSSGDIASVSNIAELQKDLSAAVWLIVDNQLNGQILTDNVILDIESRIRGRIGRDDRINSINEVSVRKTRSGSIARVTISADSIYGNINQEITDI